ncbi:hypothetical protein Cgig2_025297 [Carnegiea gigantea]|uniref:Uncharacterized protein n=1 Tax=Carnegiea gigantea TaxID=171969 RepID=A0A9Q1QF57_9CARY|nr:hypothetical protein Cgig2_025297 [Carnegiea gigantea]
MTPSPTYRSTDGESNGTIYAANAPLGGGAWPYTPCSKKTMEEEGSRKTPSWAARVVHAPPLHGGSDGFGIFGIFRNVMFLHGRVAYIVGSEDGSLARGLGRESDCQLGCGGSCRCCYFGYLSLSVLLEIDAGELYGLLKLGEFWFLNLLGWLLQIVGRIRFSLHIISITV